MSQKVSSCKIKKTSKLQTESSTSGLTKPAKIGTSFFLKYDKKDITRPHFWKPEVILTTNVNKRKKNEKKKNK